MPELPDVNVIARGPRAALPGRSCVRCGRSMGRVLVTQRGTHYNPRYQRLPA